MVELLCVNSVINQDKVPIPNSSTWFFLVLQQHLILFKSINVFVLSSNEEKQRKQLMGNKLLLQLLLLLPLLHAYSGISTVRYLPGYHGPLPFELETGFCPSSPSHLHTCLLNNESVLWFFWKLSHSGTLVLVRQRKASFSTTSSNLRELQQKTLFLSG